MKKSIIPIALLLVCFYTSQGQVDPLYAQYLNNPLLINSAYTGLNNNFNASVTYRKQWAGFDGSPSTVNVSAHTSLFDNKMGVGLIVLQDKAGNSKNTELQATYAYRIKFDDKVLSFGLQAGFLSFKSDNSELNIYDPDDPAFVSSQNITKPSFGAGIILNNERYFFGLSVPRMLSAKSTIDNITTELYSQHFYLTAAYMIFLNENVRLKPSVLLKAVKGAPVSADLNFAANLNDKYTAGAFTRNLNTFGLLGMIKFGEGYRIGYTFEVPSNKSVGARFTSHEFTFGLNIAMLGFHETSVTNF